MRLLSRFTILVCCAIWNIGFATAQLPFYTDDPDVTAPGTLHFEFFNEFDGLQSAQYPNLNQNTANFKLNYGLSHGLELDVDAPYISIYRSPGTQASSGLGDTDMGIKWQIREVKHPLGLPALAASFYVEAPTGDAKQQLGSGLTDYWLNTIAQEPFSDKTRLTANFGYLFAGNTGTGVIGIQTARGHVYTGGLSLVHDFTSRLSLGAEAYGGLADTTGLGKNQLQGLVGGLYTIHTGLSLAFGLLGGRYEASPRIGGQLGFAVDFPELFRRSH